MSGVCGVRRRRALGSEHPVRSGNPGDLSWVDREEGRGGGDWTGQDRANEWKYVCGMKDE